MTYTCDNCLCNTCACSTNAYRENCDELPICFECETCEDYNEHTEECSMYEEVK